MFLEKGKIIKKLPLDGYYLFLVKSPRIAQSVNPGQFVNIRPSFTFDPLLRRPMSVMDSDGVHIKLLIKRTGRGTELIINKEEGDMLDLLGPLGRGFEPYRAILVGGGTGLAPLYFYRRRYRELTVEFLVGFRTRPKDDLLDLLLEAGADIATEDGSYGFKGTVIELLKTKNFEGRIYSAGPPPMLKRLEKLKEPSSIYVSIETIMGCGTGICMGCAVKVRDEERYLRACKDGPVFKLSSIEL